MIDGTSCICSDLDSNLVAVADADWNTAKGCIISYIITHL